MKGIACVLAASWILAGTAVAQQKDATGCKDHPLFTRMPDSWLYNCQEKTFAAREFATGAGKTTPVEGHFWNVTYYPQSAVKTRPSELQILRNFENAVTRLGGSLVFATKNRETLRLAREGREFWIEVWAEFTGKYGLFIVQKEAMAQDVVANAEAFSSDIDAAGHAAVYGILFDTDKADIKPESAQAIAEVAKLLRSKPALKIFVVGHTDNAGTVEHNLTLSQARAQAVTQALVRDHAVAASRLRAYGAGPFAPVASNDAEIGRAKNRRVELVKQ